MGSLKEQGARMNDSRANRKVRAIFTSALIAMATQSVYAQNTIIRRVDVDAPPSGDGTSWATAYNNLQTALSNSNPSESEIYQLWVAEGTYKATSGTDRSISFGMKSRVEIYGGFDATESVLEDRNWEANVTTLSGDIGTIDVSTDNSYHVMRADGVNATAHLDGFTVEKRCQDDLFG